MFASYADETGHAKDPAKNHLGLAGLLATSENWELFDSEWRLICREEAVALPFHMTDFAASRKQFSAPAWKDKNKRPRLLPRFLDAIERADTIPVGAVVNLPDFNSLTQEQRIALGHEKQEAYYVAFQSCTRELVCAAGLLSRAPDKVSMTYAKLKKFAGVAEELWHVMQEETPLGNFMGSYRRGNPADCTPLQAADFWAYELGHHLHRILPEGRRWRRPFERFVHMGMRKSYGHRFFTYFDRSTMLEVIGELP
jgi:hypothetical protein